MQLCLPFWHDCGVPDTCVGWCERGVWPKDLFACFNFTCNHWTGIVCFISFSPAPYKTVTKSISKSAAGGELVLSCQSEGYPVSAVAWEDAHGQKLNATTAVVTTADQLFRITTQVRVGSSQKNNYTCSFHSNGSSATFLIPGERDFTMHVCWIWFPFLRHVEARSI